VIRGHHDSTVVEVVTGAGGISLQEFVVEPPPHATPRHAARRMQQSMKPSVRHFTGLTLLHEALGVGLGRRNGGSEPASSTQTSVGV
jgi:hypothetical protein